MNAGDVGYERLTAQEIIEREYGKTSRNIITPHVSRYGLLRWGAYEVSTGTGILHERIWGLSIVQLNSDGTTARLLDVSRCFHSYARLRRFVHWLRRQPMPPTREQTDETETHP